MSADERDFGVPGWDRLRHGGLLFDTARLETLTEFVPEPLNEYVEQQLRQRASSMLDGPGDPSTFVTFVLEKVCGFDDTTGSWARGSTLPSSWARRAVTGENVKPRHLWQGQHDALLPVFIDNNRRVGIGKGRHTISRVLGWLRAGNSQLALITNGRQWRLLFAGLGHDAWCEWDLDLWFDEGEFSPQVTALRTLLNFELWTPKSESTASPLLQAIRDTRKGQADLSEELGERVRKTVEKLLQSHSEHLKNIVASVSPADIYRAACRVAMRLIIILFAESRDLLPRYNALYHSSYGLNGLFDQLERNGAHGADLVNSSAAWPRILALFNLVRQGSHHPDLPGTTYGGELFSEGKSDTEDGVSKALHVFEHACFESESTLISDLDIFDILKLLTRTTTKIHRGRGARTTTVTPVDFSDLSSEYIGVLYEGLLDYELKTAPSNDPIVFLSIGHQPALPLSRLEEMRDSSVRMLFKALKENKATSETDNSEDDEQASEDTELENEANEPSFNIDDETSDEFDKQSNTSDERYSSRLRAEAWARRAVQIMKLARKPKGRNIPERRLALERETNAKAKRLVARVVLPGEYYLVRWGGTRKGSGSFYTRPGLAVPTVQHTLRPLAYDSPQKTDRATDTMALSTNWIPKLPEQILDIKVCDPACGSGTFPLAALRFLTDALYASLQHYQRIERDGERSLIRLLGIHHDKNLESNNESSFSEELIPCPPDDDDFEARLKAVLRRHVVERCIYAVDLDPLAVELCRLSLWIETMNRNLPFGFLDHKVRCGNTLIGTWFSQFQQYPVMAWKNREGGDKNHSNGIHFEKNDRTKKIKTFVKDRLPLDLKLFLQGRDLLQEDQLEAVKIVHKDTFDVLKKMHEMPMKNADERARIYRQNFLGSADWISIKKAMDLWCACWFWPADETEHAPLPSNFTKPSYETRIVAEKIASEIRFFHWEIEFPDVFKESKSGFDAILGNPPWDVQKPISKEFFSDIDPLYRSYNKQEALRHQSSYFKNNRDIERRWLDYNADFRARSNFFNYAWTPFGDPEESDESKNRFVIARGKNNLALHQNWRQARDQSVSFADPRHPFRYQGSADINLYKLFLETAHALLKPGGRLGFIIPSGLFSDKGTQTLRKLFLDSCQWEWLFGFINRKKIFPIDSRYKFNPVIIEKNGFTKTVRTAFMNDNLEDWERAEKLSTPYAKTRVEKFSPKSQYFLEIQSQNDLEILEKIYRKSVLVGNDNSTEQSIRYITEFHMTNDSRLFPSRRQWEKKGYRPDEYNRWLQGDWQPVEELWKSLDINPTDPEPGRLRLEEQLLNSTEFKSQKPETRFIHNHSLEPGDVARTNWKLRCAQPPYDQLPVPRSEIPAEIIFSRENDAYIEANKIKDIALPLYTGKMFDVGNWATGSVKLNELEPLNLNPKFLLSINNLRHNSLSNSRTVFRRISNATNERSFVATLIPGLFPCSGNAPILNLSPHSLARNLGLAGVLTSFAFDWTVRQHLSATTLTWHVVESLPLPYSSIHIDKAKMYLARLLLGGVPFSSDWLQFSNTTSYPNMYPCTSQEKLRITVILNAIVAAVMGLSMSDLRHILAECDYPAGDTISKQPKGFWRVDKDKEPELRQTVLSLIAFEDLEKRIKAANGNVEEGIDSFLAQNHGEGWLLPETLCLAGHDLGHDERAKHPQPVASRLGPRFYDWQLIQTPEEAWKECHLHTRNLLGASGYIRRIVELIEHRISNNEEYFELLTPSFVRDFMGEDGFVKAVLKLRVQKILDEASYTKLLNHLKAHDLLDEVRYRRQRERITSTPVEDPLPKVAELPADYSHETLSKDNQKKMFE